jgi:hypothetical protein
MRRHMAASAKSSSPRIPSVSRHIGSSENPGGSIAARDKLRLASIIDAPTNTCWARHHSLAPYCVMAVILPPTQLVVELRLSVGDPG